MEVRVPSLDEMRRRFSRQAAEAPPTSRSPETALEAPKEASPLRPVSPDAMPPHYKTIAAQTIVEGAVRQLAGAKAINRVKSGWWVDYQSREWSVETEVEAALKNAAGMYPPRMPKGVEVRDAALEQVANAVERIKEAAIARLFPAGRDAKDGSVSTLDSALEDLDSFEDDEEPATSRSAGEAKPKAKVDLRRMKAKQRAERAPLMARPAHKSGHVPSYTLSVDGKDAVLGFGKHKGKRLTDIVQVDKGYLEWMLKSPGDFARELLDVVRYVVNNPLSAKRMPR